MIITIIRKIDDIHGRGEIKINGDLKAKNPEFVLQYKDHKWKTGISAEKVKEWAEILRKCSISCYIKNSGNNVIDSNYWEMTIEYGINKINLHWYHDIPAEFLGIKQLFQEICIYNKIDVRCRE